MNTRQKIVCGILAVIFALAFTACDDGSGSNIAVTFSSVSANGNSVQTTTQLILTFSQAISGLTAGDISLSGVSGVSKGTLSGSGPTYTLPVSGFTLDGTLSVSVSKSGYDISPPSRTATIYYYNSEGSSDITYTVTQIGGEDGVADSTDIVFTFSASVDSLNLTAADITIGGTASKGQSELSGTETTRTFAIMVNSAGTATVTIAKTGIEAETKHVTVYKAGEYAPTLTSITAVYTGTAAIYPTTPLNNLKANLTVKAHYSNGDENTLSEHEYNLDGTLIVGTSTVTVTYTDSESVTQTTTFDVIVTAKTLTGITLNTASVEKAYGQNEQLDLSGLVVTANYSDDSSEIVSYTSASPAHGSTLTNTGIITVSVSYTEGAVTETADFTVTVVGISSIAITKQPDKTTYGVGDILDITGLVVTATYSDNSTKTVTVTAGNITGFDSTVAGTKTLTITYEGQTATFTVSVVNVTIITITKQPTKTVYKTGEALDLTGLEVTAVYGDNSTGIALITAANITGFDTTAAGSKTVTITYGGKTATFTVTVIALTGIEVTKLPNKTVYLIGEQLDITGIEVTATYSDNSTETADVTTANIAGFSSAAIGEKTLIVIVSDKTTTFTVTVITVSEIEITQQPDKTLYRTGEPLDLTGLEVTVRHTEGSITVTAGYTLFWNGAPISGGSTSVTVATGDKTVTVSWLGKTASFTITVLDTATIIVTNTEEWAAALDSISTGGNNQTYTIYIKGDIPVPGSTAYSFGTVTNLNVTLWGNGRLYLTSQGNILRLTANQTLSIDSGNLTLEGLTSGKNGATQDNNTAVVYIYTSNSYSQTALYLRNGTISGNTSSNSGGGVTANGNYSCFYMYGGTISGNTVTGSSGGGVYINLGRFYMYGGIISGNTAYQGGGVYASGYTDSNTGWNGFFSKPGGGIIYGNNAPNEADRNTATRGDTYGHAGYHVAFDRQYYRDTTFTENDCTEEWGFPNNAGETSNGWTMK